MSIVQLPISSTLRWPVPSVIAADLASIAVEQYHQIVSKVSTMSERIEVLIADNVIASIPVADLILETA